MRSAASTADVPHRGYVFGEFVLDADRAALLHNGKNVGLRPQSLDVLRHLVEHHGCLVEKEELLEAIWGNVAVSDDSLTHCLIDIRKVLGDTDRKMIRTVPRRGFIFDLPVETISSAARLDRRRNRTKLKSSIAAGILLIVGAGYFLTQASTPNSPPQTGAVSSASFLGSEATDLYMQGRFLFNRRASNDLVIAEELLKQAVNLEPEFAEAWAELAGIYAIRNLNTGGANPEAVRPLKHAAEKAVELDPELAAGWVRLAHYYTATNDLPAAERHMQRAINAKTQGPLLLAVMAGDFAENGDIDRAIELQQHAVVLDPLSVVNRSNLAGYLLAAGRYDDALREGERARRLRPADGERVDLSIGSAFIQLGQYQRALTLAASWPDGSQKDVVTAMAALALNHRPVAASAMARLRSSTDIESYIHRAELEAFCANIERSFLILAQLRDQFDGQLEEQEWRAQLLLINLSPFLAPVRADPRWEVWLEEAQRTMIARLR